MAPLPAQMQAIQIKTHGGVEVLDDVTLPVPSPTDGQILVRNDYAGVNYIDTYFRTGLYETPLPVVLGREGSGTVIESKSPLFKEGDRVVYMAVRPGSYANYSCVPAVAAVHIPDGVSTELACASFLQGLTAWTFIHEAAQVKAGQWTLVHAAAGGVGSLLVQMLRTIGAKIIGTAGSPEKCGLATKNGADYMINSRDEDLVARVREITGGHGVDAIFDGVGKATWDMDLKMIARKGSLVSFGNASGAVPPISISSLGAKNVRLFRPVVNNYVSEREELEKYSSELFGLIISGKVKVAIHKVYALKDAAQSHTDLEGRGTTGKLIINCT